MRYEIYIVSRKDQPWNIDGGSAYGGQTQLWMARPDPLALQKGSSMRLGLLLGHGKAVLQYLSFRFKIETP
jgi:hypothetical protein